MKFHDKLIELRKAKGWSQEELGARLKVTRQTVSKWEMGQTTPEMDKLVELGRLLGVSIDMLVGNGGAGVPPEYSGAVIYTRRPIDYEYKSKRKLFGLPLVHINIGFGVRRAKGIIAFGNIATGLISFGAVSVGLISFGALSLGLLLAFGGFAVGSFAIGGVAAGAVAAGGISFGWLAAGGVALGKYAMGGVAIASDIAKGGYAQAHVAIGAKASGEFVWEKIGELSEADRSEIRATIVGEYPKLWMWLVHLFS